MAWITGMTGKTRITGMARRTRLTGITEVTGITGVTWMIRTRMARMTEMI